MLPSVGLVAGGWEIHVVELVGMLGSCSCNDLPILAAVGGHEIGCADALAGIVGKRANASLRRYDTPLYLVEGVEVGSLYGT